MIGHLDRTEDCPLAIVLAGRLRDARTDLTTRWFDRISERVALEPHRVFPDDGLLDHMPILIAGIADYLERPAAAIAGQGDVVSKAMALGELRHAQGFDEHEILKEFELFGAIIFAFFTRTIDQIDEPCSRGELAACYQRLFQAVTVVQQATSSRFHQLAKARVAERESRLRLFHRALSHELRNDMGAALGGSELMQVPDIPDTRRVQLAALIARNLNSMRATLDNLLELTRVDHDARAQRHILLRQAAAEAVRALRDAAQSAGVSVRIGPDIPEVEVNAPVVELCLSNLVSNAIKYADPARRDPWIAITGRIDAAGPNGDREVIVEVRDNGLGVPERDRSRLFERFFRSDAVRKHRIGTGLGLSIVRDTVESLGGRVWAEFPDQGTIFAFSMPCRRHTDT
jgi:signal transduction histidine kinase